MQQITQIAILMIAVILMQTLTTAKIVFAMKIWIVMVRLNWLEMATAMMKPIMKNAILMVVTVVGPVLIWSNALIADAWLDPLPIIYVSYLIELHYSPRYSSSLQDPILPPYTARLRICTTLSWPVYSSFQDTSIYKWTTQLYKTSV